MKDDLLSDIGENYEYVRTIISNNVELFKIHLSENSSKLVGLLAIVVISLIFALIILVGLFVAIALLIGNLIHSTGFGLLIACVIYAIIAMVIIKNRRKWFFEPIAYAFFQRYEKKSKK